MNNDKVFLGVCKWLAEKFNLNVTGLRILFIVAVLSGFRIKLFALSPVALYFILFLLKPKNR